jgi:hypothetical protein
MSVGNGQRGGGVVRKKKKKNDLYRPRQHVKPGFCTDHSNRRTNRCRAAPEACVSSFVRGPEHTDPAPFGVPFGVTVQFDLLTPMADIRLIPYIFFFIFLIFSFSPQCGR